MPFSCKIAHYVLYASSICKMQFKHGICITCTAEFADASNVPSSLARLAFTYAACSHACQAWGEQESHGNNLRT